MNSNFENWLLELTPELSIRQCLSAIEKNTHGAAILVDHERKICGVLTDGDIRRALLGGQNLETRAETILNRNPVTVSKGTSREEILKALDQKTHFVPSLVDGKVVDVLTRDSLKYNEEKELQSRAKAPARVSFAGGGTDLTSYFMQNKGAVLNATIAMYSRASLKTRADSKVIIHSHDLNIKIAVDHAECLVYDGNLDLIKALIKLLEPKFGFELEIASEFPVHSGLGGSSAVSASVIACFNQLRLDKLTPFEMAELAFHAERIELQYPGGWQDQYASVLGGFNFMEFTADMNDVSSITLPTSIVNELEDRLLLCHLNIEHPQKAIHIEQAKTMLNDDSAAKAAKKSTEIAYDMRTLLQRGRIDKIGRLLHDAWLLKKQFSNKISNEYIDSIYNLALASGVIGGKVLGAGGGGYLLLFTDANSRNSVISVLKERGLSVSSLRFNLEGVQSWMVQREKSSETVELN